MNIHNRKKDLWWVRTACTEIRIAELRKDSEGSEYFVDMGDKECVYDNNAVVRIRQAHQPVDTNAIKWEPNLSEDANDQVYCGSRALSLKGWTIFWCGKCPTCRVSGRGNRAARSKVLRLAKRES